MKKLLLILSLFCLTFVSCTKNSTLSIEEQELETISYDVTKSSFKSVANCTVRAILAKDSDGKIIGYSYHVQLVGAPTMGRSILSPIDINIPYTTMIEYNGAIMPLQTSTTMRLNGSELFGMGIWSAEKRVIADMNAIQSIVFSNNVTFSPSLGVNVEIEFTNLYN